MSRRPAPGADRAAQNAQTIKALLKLEGNKTCADCKRNKHPRWASWNIGVFVCIRCSGIHRGMGTHISRVKSVDLDAWTDEQLQSILKWGNSRANKYWEAKLAVGHVPSEAKIENFIRTKYESKRWVMDGPIPDPASLDAAGDDDVPLNLVQEKAKIERSTSQRNASAPQPQLLAQPKSAAASIDLFGDDPTPPVRPRTTDLPSSNPPAVTAPPGSKSNKPGDSLFGLDFFGGPQPSSSGRPSSALSNPTTSSGSARSDLKSSILSLYASAPKPQAPSLQSHSQQPSFGGMTSPQPAQQDAFGGLTDSLNGLNFASNPTVTQQRQPVASSAFSAFSDLTTSQPSKATPSAPQITSPAPLSGGDFFSVAKSNPAPKQTQPKSPTIARPVSNGLDFGFAHAAVSASKPRPNPVVSQDLFAADDWTGFTAPSPEPPPVPPPTGVSSPAPKPATDFSSAFNLSSPSEPAQRAAPSARAAVVIQSSTSMVDPWGSSMDSNAWGAPDPQSAKTVPSTVALGKVPSRITPNDISGGWGAPMSGPNKTNNPPAVMADEDFGGWTSASPTQPTSGEPAKRSGGFSAPSDPFDNPWG